MGPTSQAMRSKSPSSKWAAIWLLATWSVVVVAHVPVIHSQARSFDDNQYLTDNVLVQDPGWKSARRFLTEVRRPSTVEGYYQPLTMISLMLDFARSGTADDLRPYHQTNLFLHGLNCALIAWLLYALFGNATAAAAAAMFFGVHPITIEPVAWVAERKTLLATTFALGCLICHVRFARRAMDGRRGLSQNSRGRLFYTRPAYYGGLGLFVLALMSKPTAVPVPLLMLLLDYWPLRRLSRRAVVEKLPFLLIAGLFAVITITSQRHAASVTMPGGESWLRVPLIVCHNVVFYLRQIVRPAELWWYHPFPKSLELSDGAVRVGVIGTAVLVPLIVLSLRWTRAVVTGALFFFIAIFPTMGVIGFTHVIASDKYAYLPMVGLLLMVTAGACHPAVWGFRGPGGRGAVGPRDQGIKGSGDQGSAGPNERRLCDEGRDELCAERSERGLAVPTGYRWPGIVALVLVFGLAFVLADRTQAHLAYWKDTETLYRRMVALAPDHAAAPRANLGMELAARGELGEAIRLFKEAIERDPRQPHTHNALADAFARTGDADAAAAEYETALRLDPDFADAHNNYGNLLADLGRTEDAMRHYEAALRARPELADAHNNIGALLTGLGRAEDADRHLREALRLRPGFADAHHNLALLLAGQGRLEEAIGEYETVLRLRPEHDRARNNLGAALLMLGRTDEALTCFRLAAAINPKNVSALMNAGNVLRHRGDNAGAAEYYRRVLAIAPDHAAAREGLDQALGESPDRPAVTGPAPPP